MRLLLTLISLLSSSLLLAQLNMNQLGSLDVGAAHSGTGCNDIWGYVDENGNEYALVGTMDGVSVVNVTDPANPVEVFWAAGMNSIWRDIKTYGDFAYITTEADEGLMIIDLTPLPASSTLSVTHYSGPSGNEWYSAHNLFQANGYLYIFGAGRGNGGLIMLDVATDPLNPIEVGVFDTWYVHDGTVRNDTAYLANIYEGFFSIVDVTNKAAPVLLGTAITPTQFAHNIWYSANGKNVFTTDEVPGGYIGAFDVSNPASPVLIDKIQSSPGNNIVPHNAHVLGNYLYTSYYTDGVVVHDITYPYNMVEVGNFDTSPLSSPNTEGCWGVYPFLPSGNIIASDRQEGLFILGKSLTQGCYLEGLVTEFGSGTPLNNVKINILGSTITDYSNVSGNYATGIEAPGGYDVEFFKVLYFPETLSVNLATGSILTEDVELTKIPQFSITVKVMDAVTLLPVQNVNVLLEHTYVNHTGTTDINGEAVIDLYYQDNYQLFAGKWGYNTGCFEDTLITNSTGTIEVYIKEGYYDDFVFDYGWTSTGTAARGFWEREIPVGVASMAGFIENPFYDANYDCGGYAYLTGNGTEALNTEEVNDGEVVLISPTFDLTGYTDPHINYATWFFNKYGAFPPDDTLQIYLFNGSEMALIEEKHLGNTLISQWFPSSIPVNGTITLNSTMQLIVTLSDYVTSENVTEGGFDFFSVTDFSILETDNGNYSDRIYLYPNPMAGLINLRGIEAGSVDIYDLSGRLIKTAPVAPQVDVSNLENGVYIFAIRDTNGNIVNVSKQIKQ